MTLARLRDALLNETPRGVLGCTYGFDPEYWEQEILPAIIPSLPEAKTAVNSAAFLNGGDTVLRRCPTVVCCDHTGPGRELPYEIVRIRSGAGAFHPKLLLVDYGSSIHVIVGSANLTRSGWSSAFEVFTYEALRPSSSHPWVPPLTRFLEGTIDLVDSAAERDLIEPFIDRVRMVKAPRRGSRTGKTPRLVSSFDGALLDAAVDEGSRANHIHAVTPFLEGEEGAGVFDRLSEALPKAKGTLYLRSEDAEGVPVIHGPEQKLKGLLGSGKWQLRRVDAEWDGDDEDAPPRQLHGKILALTKGGAGVALVGSANVTRAALMGKAPNANVELCALVKLGRRGLEQLLPPSSELIAEEVQFAPAPEDEGSPEAIWVDSATYDCRTERLELELSRQAPKLVVSYEGAELGLAEGGVWSAELALGKSLEITVRDSGGMEQVVPFVLLNPAQLPPRGLTRRLRLDELLDVLAGSREPVTDETEVDTSPGSKAPEHHGTRLGASSAFAWRKLMRAFAGIRRDLINSALYPIEIERLLDGPLGLRGLMEMLAELSEGDGFLAPDRAVVVHQARLALADAAHSILEEKQTPDESSTHLERWQSELQLEFERLKSLAHGPLAAQLKMLERELAAGAAR